MISQRLKCLQYTGAYVHSYCPKQLPEGLKALKNGSQLKLIRGETAVVAAGW